MTNLLALIRSRVRRAMYACAFVGMWFLSIFTLLAPRHVLEHLQVWEAVVGVSIAPVWWLSQFVRSLYRGGE